MQQLDQVTDGALFREFLAGDDMAFDRFVSRYEKNVYLLAVYLTQSMSEAEAILSEVFLRVLKDVSDLTNRECMSAHVYKITIQILEEHPTENLNESLSIDTWASDEQADLLTSINHTINYIPQHCRAAFVLKDVLGLDIEQLSEILSMGEHLCRVDVKQARMSIFAKTKSGSTSVSEMVAAMDEVDSSLETGLHI